MSADTDQFPRQTAGLPARGRRGVVDVSAGEEFELQISAVSKRLGDATVRMLAYNGSIPGPILRMAQGFEIVVDVANHGDLEATMDQQLPTEIPILAGAR